MPKTVIEGWLLRGLVALLSMTPVAPDRWESPHDHEGNLRTGCCNIVSGRGLFHNAGCEIRNS